MSASRPGILKNRSWLRPRKRDLEKQDSVLKLIEEIISKNPDLSQTQETLVVELRRIWDCSAAMVGLLNEGHNELILCTESQDTPIRDYPINLQKDDSLLAQCIQSKKPVRVNAAAGEINLHRLSALNNYKPSSILCAPLIFQEIALGAIAIFNHRPKFFSARDETLIMQIASVIASVIYHKQTIMQLKVANASLEVERWHLLNSRNILRTLVDNLPTSIYIIDRNYSIVAVNLHRARRVNSPPKTLVGRLCYEAFYQREDICPGCQVMETIYEGVCKTRSQCIWEDEYEHQEWEISTYPIFDDAGQVTKEILIEQDVTEKRRLESTLAQSEKLAAVGQLAAGIAHEINNPLTAIIANAQILQRELPINGDHQELVDLIARAGARAAQVVRSLLDLSRKDQQDFEPTDVNDTIYRALELLQHEITARGVDLVFEPAQDLHLIQASQNHLQGVWLNLISNAMDAANGGQCSIHMSTHRHENGVQLIISDNGRGIPSEQLPRIFEPFYTTKAPGHGTGLGLSVCHRVIKQHGGRILVDSQLGQGTQFTIILPSA